MQPETSTSDSRRHLLWLMALLLAVVGPAAAFALSARAALPGHTVAGEFTKFEIDGDIAGTDDWAGGGYGGYTTAQGRPSAGILEFAEAEDACDASPDTGWNGSYTDGPYPWPTEPDASPNPTKGDVCEIGTAYEMVNVDGQYHWVLYYYVAREPGGTGDRSTMVVLDLPGQVGDQIIEFDYDPSGSADFTKHVWDGSAWDSDSLADDETVQLAVGPSPFGGADSEDGTFVELAIDLTANGLFPQISQGGEAECGTLTAGDVVTFVGNNSNSQMADRASFPDPVTLGNCADVVVTKDTQPASVSGTFEYLLDQADGGAVHDDTLAGGGADKDASVASITSDITGGEQQAWNNVSAGPDYQLDETMIPAGWALEDITCTYHDPVTGQTVTDQSVVDGTFPVPPPDASNGVTTQCTITNATSGLVVEKVGAGDPAADFTFSVTDGDDQVLSLGEATDVLPHTPGTEVTISEIAPAASPAWEYLGASCVSDAQGEPVTFAPGEDVTVTTEGGQVVTCTFENQQASGLVVDKVGQPQGATDPFDFDWDVDDGDTDGTSDFQVTIAGPGEDSGDIAPGTYTVVELLGESTADPAFELTDITCEITTTGAATSTSTTSVADATAEVDLAAGDVVTCTFTNLQDGRLVVEKETGGDVDGTFEFTGDVAGSITTSGGATPAGDELSADVAAGTHAVSEVVPAGWELSAATCDDQTGTLDGSDLAGIEVGAGEVVTCTFVNDPLPGSVEITKSAVGGDGTFTFEVGQDGDTPVEYAVTTTDGSGSITIDDLAVGSTYTIGEADPGSSWIAGELTCEVTHADGATEPVDPATGFEVAPGDQVACEITNTARGDILVVKNVAGTNGTFDFTGDWPDGTPALDGGSFSVTTTDGSGQQLFEDVTPGSHSIAEVDPTPLYDGTILECIDSDPQGTASGDDGALTGMIELDPGETVTCTYSNTQRATITVIKDAVPDDDQEFDFTTSGAPLPAGFALGDDGTGTANTWLSELIPADATYSISETDVPGWVLDSATCDNGDDASAITPAPGTNVTCTFVNVAAPGSIVVDKTVAGVPETFEWSFEIGINPVAEGVDSPQTVAGTGNTSDSVTFQPLALNETYTLTEPTLPAGWEQTFTCDGDDASDDPGYQVTITDPGQVVECDIVNEAQPGSIVLDKQVENLHDGSSWSFDFTLDGDDGTSTQVTLDQDTSTTTFGDVALLPGVTYGLTEAAADGFDASMACTVTHADGSTTTSSGPWTIAPGDGIDCTATNTAQPAEATVVKTSIGGDGTFEFVLAGSDGAEFPFAITTEDGTGEITTPIPTVGDGVVFSLAEVDPGPEWTVGDLACTVERGGAVVELDPGAFTIESNDVITCAITNTTQADVAVAKTGTTAVLLPATGGSATVGYTVEVTNNGPAEAADVTVADVLPDEVTLADVVPSAGTCSASVDGFTCDLGTMASGDVVTIAVATTTVADVAAGEVVNTVEVNTTTPETDPTNNGDDHRTSIERRLPRTGVDVDMLATAAVLLILLGLALEQVAGRRRRRQT